MKNKNRVGLFFALAALSLSMLNLGLIISKNHYKPQVVKLEQQVDELKKRKPVIIYQVDNAGGELIGTVTDKAIVDGHYTVTIGDYGKFLVTKEQYKSINVGDDAPSYLKREVVR